MESYKGDVVKAGIFGRKLGRQFELPFSGSYFFFFVGLFPLSQSIVYLLGQIWSLHFLTEIFFLFTIPKVTKDLIEGAGKLAAVEENFNGISPAVTFFVFHFCLFHLLREGYRTVTLEQLFFFLFTFYPAALYSQRNFFRNFFKEDSSKERDDGESLHNFEEKYRERARQRQQSEFWRQKLRDKNRKKASPKKEQSYPQERTIEERRSKVFTEEDIMLGERKYTDQEVFLFFSLEPNSPKEQLKKAYRSFLKENHPDFISGSDSTSEKILFAKRKTELAIKLFRQVS